MADYKKARMEILTEMDDLQNNHCETCSRPHGNTIIQRCGGCPILSQLQDCGKRLEAIAAARKQAARAEPEARQSLKVADSKTKKHLQQKTVKTAKEPIALELTKETYMQLKKDGLPDKEIRKKFNMSNARYYAWKDKNLTEEERAATRNRAGAKNLENTASAVVDTIIENQSSAPIAAESPVESETVQVEPESASLPADDELNRLKAENQVLEKEVERLTKQLEDVTAENEQPPEQFAVAEEASPAPEWLQHEFLQLREELKHWKALVLLKETGRI